MNKFNACSHHLSILGMLMQVSFKDALNKKMASLQAALSQMASRLQLPRAEAKKTFDALPGGNFVSSMRKKIAV